LPLKSPIAHCGPETSFRQSQSLRNASKRGGTLYAGLWRHWPNPARLALNRDAALLWKKRRCTYSIGKRTRLRTNLLPQGCEVSGETLGSGVVKASHSVATALEIAEGTEVVESHRITLADGKPIAFGTSWYPADRFPDFAERREDIGSATETYKSYGIEDYLRRRDTEMYARQAKPEEAKTLKQHPDLPVIVVRKIDTDTDGTPISHSKVIWASGRVKFTISGQDDG